MTEPMKPRDELASAKEYPPIERVWLLLSNVTTKGKFRVSLEINGVAEEIFHSYVEQDEVVVSESHNLTWLIEKSAKYQAALDEIEGLKKLLRRVNQYVFPGETDSIDSLKKIIAENEKLKRDWWYLKHQDGTPYPGDNNDSGSDRSGT